MTDYSRGILKQIEELTDENKRLKAENQTVKAENRQLRQKLEALERSLEEKIAKAVEKACAPLYERIKYLEKQNERKDSEIARLKAQINKDSSNSSKPPGTDGFKKVPNLRENSGKKAGGQKGHKGVTLTVPKNLDELVKEGKAERLLVDLTGGAEEYVSKWQVDLKTTVVYTEYRYPSGSCLPGVFYGSELKAYSVLLSNNGIIAEGRLSEYFREITDGLIPVSEATIEKFNIEAAAKVDMEGIKRDLLNAPVMHVDETALRCAQLLEHCEAEPRKAKKASYDVTIRTHSSTKATMLTVNAKKDDEGVVRDGIVPAYCGILSHDHDRKYYKYGESHATCCAHLLRELKGLHELYNIQWADKLRKFYIGMNEYKNKTQACEHNKLLEFESSYDELLNEGDAVLGGMEARSFGYKELRPILKRLRNYKDAYMLFIRDYAAPFTNNQAERDLRHCKTKQKISGCFRSWNGVVCYAKIRSFLSTALKRQKNLLAELKRLFAATLYYPAEQ